jgi:hypothetical protein
METSLKQSYCQILSLSACLSLSRSRFSLAIASRDDLNSCCADGGGKRKRKTYTSEKNWSERMRGGEEKYLTEKAREKQPGADQPPWEKHALSHDNDAITDDIVRPCSQHKLE